MPSLRTAPRATRIAPRKRVLKDIPPLRFGEGRDCTLPACVAVATGLEYDWVMGASRAAFTAAIDVDAWDPIAAAPLDDATLQGAARRSGMRAVAAAEASDRALATWIAALRDDARWTDTRHAGAAAFGDHAMRTLLADKRTAAASFLRTTRALFAGSPGADLLRAAESYGYVADAAKKVGIGPFGASVATRFLDAGHRRSWAKQLEAALGHERDA